MSTQEEQRRAEFVKYDRAYTKPKYRMKRERWKDAVNDLRALPCRGSYLDVSCGNSEMLRAAERLGFGRVMGTEIVGKLLVPERVVYAEVHKLPFADKSFEVVTMFDVIEHLVRPDDEAACREMTRVASRFVVLTANNRPSLNAAGDNLHINIRTYAEWHESLKAWFAPAPVEWIKGDRHYVSEAYKVTL